MKKRYWLNGGIAGTIIAIIISIYFASQNSCIGLYANPNGTFGTVCPKVNIFLNLQNSIYIELITVIVFFLVGALLGWLYGKIKNRKRV